MRQSILHSPSTKIGNNFNFNFAGVLPHVYPSRYIMNERHLLVALLLRRLHCYFLGTKHGAAFVQFDSVLVLRRSP